MKTFLSVDRYLQIIVVFWALIFGGTEILFEGENRFYALVLLPVWHVSSFLIRLLLPYPKSTFYKIYACYLLVFLSAYLIQEWGNVSAICAALSVPAGIGFIVNCYKDYDKFGLPSED